MLVIVAEVIGIYGGMEYNQNSPLARCTSFKKFDKSQSVSFMYEQY